MNDHLLQRIDDLLADESRSSWEVDFLESLKEQVAGGRTLSTKQIYKLDEIEERGR